MTTPLLLMPLAAVFQIAPQEPGPQGPERKVRIEIVTSENGETKRITREFDANDDAQMHDALRELGVMEHFKLGDEEGDMTIDIRGFGDEEDNNMFLRLAPLPPLSPDAPTPPEAPTAASCERTAYLGVSTQSMSEASAKESRVPGGKGAYVSEVIEGTPASELGLEPGDVITELAGTSIAGPQALTEAVKAQEPGTKVKVVWYRAGKKMNGSVELGERKEMSYSFSSTPHGSEAWEWENYFGDSVNSEPRAFLGVTPGDGDGESGAQIGSVEEGTAAAAMGLEAGDFITSVNGEAMVDFDMLSETIRAMRPGDEVKLDVRRNGQKRTFEGKLGERKNDITVRIPGMQDFRMEGLPPAEREELRREMDELRRELNEMRREFRRDMGQGMRREVRINVETRKLTDEEKALLKSKGVETDKVLELADLQAFPNPSSGFYRLQFDVPERGDLNVDVHDAKGERVYQERIVGFRGRYERTLDLSDQATGTYFLVISQGGRTATHKLVKE